MSDRKAAEAALAASQARYRLVVEQVTDGFWQADHRGRLVSVSDRTAQLLGRGPESLAGRRLLDFATRPPGLGARWPVGHGPQESSIEVSFARPDGEEIRAAVRATPIMDGVAFAGWLGTITDLTELRRTQAEAARRALRDDLTGLPNRAGLLRKLADCFRAGSEPGLILLDLDRFAVINDSLGRSAGDAVLGEVACRLGEICAPFSSNGTAVARTGGDEFAVVVPERADIGEFVERVAAALAVPIATGHRQLIFTACVGLAHSRPGASPEGLLREAESAMIAAQSAGRPLFFDPEFPEANLRHLEAEADLRAALDGDQLTVYFQPIVELSTGLVSQAEALVRWKRPGQGVIGPDQFIPLAEATGLIAELGDQVLRKATLEAAADWPRPAGRAAPPVAVNLSPRQLSDPGLAGSVAAHLVAAGVEASRLSLEIAETDVIRDVPAASATLRRLHDLGVSLSVDDFGTGYSSLAYLKRFPVQSLKIDRSFVSGIVRSAEDEEELSSVARLGVTHGQGYLFARPLPLPAFAQYLEAGYQEEQQGTGSPLWGPPPVARPAAAPAPVSARFGSVATAILDAADTMLIITDRSGVIQYVNPAFTCSDRIPGRGGNRFYPQAT